MVKVNVKNSSGNVKGAKVSICFDGLFSGFTKDEYTDSNGNVSFTNDANRNGTIYVNGKKIYEGKINESNSVRV